MDNDPRDLVTTFKSGMAREFLEMLADDHMDGLCNAINQHGIEAVTAMVTLLAGETHIRILERERDELEAANGQVP